MIKINIFITVRMNDLDKRDCDTLVKGFKQWNELGRVRMNDLDKRDCDAATAML